MINAKDAKRLSTEVSKPVRAFNELSNAIEQAARAGRSWISVNVGVGYLSGFKEVESIAEYLDAVLKERGYRYEIDGESLGLTVFVSWGDL